MINESKLKEKVYNFTNENLVSYRKIYNFDNAKVLSIIGSGDQYFSSLLYGAKEIDLYDVNTVAYDYFILKYYSIIILSYEEFYDFFIFDKLDNIEKYIKVRRFLPDNVRNNLDRFIYRNRKLSLISLESSLCNNSNISSRIVPYLDETNYNILQSKLRTKTPPNAYFYNLLDLPYILDNSYDIILTSNIYSGINISVKDYKELLNKFKYEQIQAYYIWIKNKTLNQEFLDNDFYINKVPSVISPKRKDYVMTLKKWDWNVISFLYCTIFYLMIK